MTASGHLVFVDLTGFDDEGFDDMPELVDLTVSDDEGEAIDVNAVAASPASAAPVPSPLVNTTPGPTHKNEKTNFRK